MSATIRVLSESTINKIAAGEVIENPASVVKELIENSIDAGARCIVIETKGGGLGLIRVSDDGKGMGKDDAVLSIQPHATSKIQEVEDLFSVQTMGFRGEALASIAAISKFTLTTSLWEKEATRIEVAGGKILSVDSASRARGTTVEVSSLFYNVPARKKFQKVAAQCSADVTKIVTHLSLAYPFISFELIQQEKRTLFAPKASLLQRSHAVLGDPFCSSGSIINFEEGEIAVKGILGAPTETRPNRGGQYLFINARSVVCPALSFAVKEGYGTRIEPNRFPTFVLHLHLPPSLLDVNVHPQKKEVRLQDAPFLKKKVKEAVFSSLNHLDSGEGVFFEEPSFSNSSHTPFSVSHSGLRFKEREEVIFPQQTLAFPEKEMHPLGVFRSYLLLDSNGRELLLVDLLAARARLVFETLQHEEKRVESQALMFPITCTFSKLEMEQLLPHLQLLQQSGFEARAIGETGLLIDAYPPFVEEEKLKDLLLELTEDLQISTRDQERKVAILATRLAKVGKKTFTKCEGVRLFEELLKSHSPHHAPLGKPIIRRLSIHEIEKLFSS